MLHNGKVPEETMKLIPLIIATLMIVFGTYLNSLDPSKDATVGAPEMIEDSVGSTMAAPVHR